MSENLITFDELLKLAKKEDRNKNTAIHAAFSGLLNLTKYLKAI